MSFLKDDKQIIQAGRYSLIDFSIILDKNYKPNWHHEEISNALERVEKGEIKRLIIQMPPRHGKSQLTSINFPAWYLGRNPDKEIITASYSADLATDFGSKTRDVVNDELYKEIFETRLKQDEQNKAKWRTNDRGSYTSVGVGGPLTGRGANVLIIDDPIKNREEAESETIRKKVWDWYTSCFVKGTPVLMGDGTWKEIDRIKKGETVVSFNEKTKRLVKSSVKETGVQSIADIYKVNTEYGEVECTGEHPFFTIKRRGKYLGLKYGCWKKASELVNGDRVLMSFHGSTGGKRLSIPKTSKYFPKDLYWLLGFILGDGFISKYRFGIALGNDEKLNKYLFDLCIKFFGKAKRVERLPRTKALMVYSKQAVDLLKYAGFVESKEKKAKDKEIPEQIFRLPITHRKAFISGFLSADGYRASKKRWQVGIASKKLINDLRLLCISSGFICGKISERRFTIQAPGSPKLINAIMYRLHIRDRSRGYYSCRIRSVEKVRKDITYNLEVENTGTFIANGFIVHNTAYTRLEKDGAIIVIMTRWHLDDLAGRLLEYEETGGEHWEVISFPAIAEDDEVYRKKGEALWKSKYDVVALENIKRNIGIYDWNALYQQNPIHADSQEFKQEWFKYFNDEDIKGLDLDVYVTVDLAISDKNYADNTSIQVIGKSRINPNIYKLEDLSGKLDTAQVIEYIFHIKDKYKFNLRKVGIESVGYQKSLMWYINEEQKRRQIYFDVVELKAVNSKEQRIRGLIPMYKNGIIFHRNTDTEYENELLTFPFGKHDDRIDAMAYLQQVITNTRSSQSAQQYVPDWSKLKK